jgi:hypothetical protein
VANTNKFRFLRASGANASLIVNDLTFQGGFANGTSAAGSGGAILVGASAAFAASDSTFTGNSSATDGGAVAVLNASTGGASSFTRTRFTGNTAVGGTGGAVIATSFGSAKFVDSVIANNTSTGSGFGAGGVAGNGFIVFDFLRTTLTGNVGTSAGAFQGAEAVFAYCTIDGNTANTGGTGGIDAALANVSVMYSTVSNNLGKQTTSAGGGIQGNKVAVLNSTVHGNTSGTGGGISGRDITVTYSTITNNIATFGAAGPGGIAGTFGTSPVVLSHSVVAGNTTTGSSETQDIPATTVTSNGFNFIGIKPAAVTLLASDQSGTKASPANPLLGPLLANGGLTASRAPLAGSPLINAGNVAVVATATTDQRGYPRFVGAKVDIGAYEVQTSNGVGLVGGNLQQTKIANAFANPVVLRVSDPHGAAVSGAKVTLAGPTFGAGPDFAGSPTGQGTSDGTGLVTITPRANTIAGAYVVGASIAGLPATPVTLRNTNFLLVQPPTFGIVADSTGSGQTNPVTGIYANPLTVTLTSSGNPVANYPVTFTAPVAGTGAGVTFPNGGTSFTVLTDATGTASAIVTANTKAGALTAFATATGYGNAAYSLTNLAGDIASIAVVSGSGQSTFLSTAFTLPLVARGFDAFGNPSPGRTITVAPPAAGASASFAQTVYTTDATGTVTTTIPTANATGGAYFVNASSGAFSADFALTNLTAPPAPPPPNSAPLITGLGTQTTTTAVPVGPLTFAVVDVETPGSQLVVTAASDNVTLVPNGNVVLAGTGNSRTVLVQPQPGQTGTAKITLTVTDTGSLSSSISFTVNVNPTPQTPPTITGIANQTVATGGTVGPLNFTVADAETPAASLTVTAVAANGTLIPASGIAITGSGADRRIQLTPATGLTGSSLVTISVTDGDGQTTTGTFTVTVTPPPPTPPAISDLADRTVTINTVGGPYSFIVTDALTPAASLTVTATSSNQTLLPNANVVLGGSGNFRAVTVTPVTGQSGTATVTVTVTNGAGLSTSDTFVVTVPATVPPPAAQGFFAGTGEGVPAVVNAYDAAGKLRLVIQPFEPEFTGGARVAVGDFNGDGIADVAVGSGPGRASMVRIFNGATGGKLAEIEPFEASFAGGIFVAAGDITGDGKADLVVTPDQGGSSRTIVYGAGLGDNLIANYFAIEDPRFRGGARATVGDFNNDGKADVIVSAGFGGGPRVAGYNGATLGLSGGPKLFADFFAFEGTLLNGTYVAAGDVNGDGFADLIAGAGPGGGPRVTVFDGKGLVGGTGGRLADFFAGPTNQRDGVRVAALNFDSDTQIDVMTGNGGGMSTIRIFNAASLLAGSQEPNFSIDAFASGIGGVFVG